MPVGVLGHPRIHQYLLDQVVPVDRPGRHASGEDDRGNGSELPQPAGFAVQVLARGIEDERAR